MNFGRSHATRSAPCRPEVNQNGDANIMNDVGEKGGCGLDRFVQRRQRSFAGAAPPRISQMLPGHAVVGAASRAASDYHRWTSFTPLEIWPCRFRIPHARNYTRVPWCPWQPHSTGCNICCLLSRGNCNSGARIYRGYDQPFWPPSRNRTAFHHPIRQISPGVCTKSDSGFILTLAADRGFTGRSRALPCPHSTSPSPHQAPTIGLSDDGCCENAWWRAYFWKNHSIPRARKSCINANGPTGRPSSGTLRSLVCGVKPGGFL